MQTTRSRWRRRCAWWRDSRRATGRSGCCCRMARHTVLRLFPEERVVDKLPESSIGCDRDQHPVPEQREAEGNQFKPAAADWRQHDQIGKSAISGKQIEQAKEQQSLREKRIETRGRRNEPNRVEQPKHRIKQSRHHRAADEEDEAEKSQRP